MARYALVIGVATYNKFPNLPQAATDAEAVARVLEKQGNFYKVQRLPRRWVKEQDRYEVAPDKRVKADDMFAVLKDFLQEAQNQEVFIYFAGHGFRVANRLGKQRGFLATSDSTIDGSNGIALDEEFNELLSQSNLSSLVVFLDCCHAGALLEDNLELNRNSLEPSLSVFQSPRDYYLITACRAGELAREEGEHGLFTGAVLQGLSQENAEPATGKVSVNRLFDFVYQRLSGSGQEPFQLGGGRSLTIVSYPPQGKKESTATAPVFSSTKEPVASVVEPPRIRALNQLKNLLPTQFNEVIFRYGIDESQLPINGTQAQKAIDVIKLASQQEGQSLCGLLDVLEQIAPHLK
ncbi:MAG: caspase family protein [Symploca sp. SIO3E6]|nr:caspase family protein [Caldora sp. SIO3E6]